MADYKEDVEVSVIVPVYNVSEYIETSIKSICEQSFDSYEVILVDDGTPDDSIGKAMAVLKKYGVKYTLVEKENGGLPSARNAGIHAANGKYVCFIDSDDVVSTTHIKDLWNVCEKNNLHVAFSLFQLTYSCNRMGEKKDKNSPIVISCKQLLSEFLIRKLRIHCCTLLINKQYLENEGIFFNEKLRYGEDIDFMWRLFPTLSEIGCTENETYMYLQRPNSLMSSQNVDQVKLLLDEFKKTVNNQKKKYPQHMKIWCCLYGKATLAFYRTFAESSDYQLFKRLLLETDYRKRIVSNLRLKSLKLKILSLCLILSPRLFVYIVKHNRETVSA